MASSEPRTGTVRRGCNSARRRRWQTGEAKATLGTLVQVDYLFDPTLMRDDKQPHEATKSLACDIPVAGYNRSRRNERASCLHAMHLLVLFIACWNITAIAGFAIPQLSSLPGLSSANHEDFQTYLATTFETLVTTSGDTTKQETENETSVDASSDDANDSADLGEMRRSMAARAALLGKNSANKRNPSQSPSRTKKDTSVRGRRGGSATTAREGQRVTATIVDAVRRTARGTAAAAELNKKHHGEQSPATLVTNSVIKTAIEDLLRINNKKFAEDSCKKELAASFSAYDYGQNQEPSALAPGAVLLEPSRLDMTTIRIATPDDDAAIASLRLSVFSDFSPEMQNQFHERSCQALHSRRLRGAVCLVARAPHKNPELSEVGRLLGSAECSFHEFFGTKLGMRRPFNSILYVTEVAVSPAARRCGIATKLLNGMDKIAIMRGVETLFLHVDVKNKGAVSLYKKAGYEMADLKDALYLDFTTSLNLQPGATKGRDHYLLYKNLIPYPTWLKEEAKQLRSDVLTGTLGFEIPA